MAKYIIIDENYNEFAEADNMQEAVRAVKNFAYDGEYDAAALNEGNIRVFEVKRELHVDARDAGIEVTLKEKK